MLLNAEIFEKYGFSYNLNNLLFSCFTCNTALKHFTFETNNLLIYKYTFILKTDRKHAKIFQELTQQFDIFACHGCSMIEYIIEVEPIYIFLEFRWSIFLILNLANNLLS